MINLNENSEIEQAGPRSLEVKLESPESNEKFSLTLKYIVGSIAICALFYLSISLRDSLNILVFATILFVLSTGITVSSLYLVTMRMIHRNTLFNQGGWLYWFLSRRTMAVIFWFSWGLITSYSLFIKMSFFTENEWNWFFSLFPVYWLTLQFVRMGLRYKASTLYQYRFTLSATSIIFPTGFAILFAIYSWYISPVAINTSLADVLNSAVVNFESDTKSALIKDGLFIYNAFNSPQQWILVNLPGAPSIAIWLFNSLAMWVLAFNLSAILALLILPVEEIKRIISPISNSLVPAKVDGGQIIYLSAIGTVFFFFIYLRGFIALEAGATHNPTYIAAREQFARIYILSVEVIEDKYYQTGTIDKVELIKNKLFGESSALVEPVHDLVNTAFNGAEGNIDKFLDDYYRVFSEYQRLGSFVIRNADEHIKNKFSSIVMNNEHFESLEKSIDSTLAQNAELLRRFEAEREQVLAEGLLDDEELKGAELEITRTASDRDFDIFEAGMDSSLAQRGSAAAVSGVLAGKVTAKLATKAGFKVATIALQKVALGAAGSAAGAATVGATIGSIIPGLGTVIGAGAGLIIGFGIDAWIIDREESKNREAFARDILQSLCESRVELLEQLKASEDKFPAHCVRGVL